MPEELQVQNKRMNSVCHQYFEDATSGFKRVFFRLEKMGRSCFQQLPMVSEGKCNLSREDSLKSGNHFGGTIFIKRELAETLVARDKINTFLQFRMYHSNGSSTINSKCSAPA